MSYFSSLSRRKFIWSLSCTCGASLILPSCADVAMSDRKQIKIFSDDYLYSKAFPAYEDFKLRTKLITNTSESQKIIDIGLSIRDAINVYYANLSEEDPTTNFQWEFILVDDDQTKNAWCMPGGKIAFYTGIMPIAKNEDGIASIMSHEISHAFARHTVEKLTQHSIVSLGTQGLLSSGYGKVITQNPDIYNSVLQFGIMLPFSRTMESEADYMGLVFMNLAGYNLNDSVEVWKRMQLSNQGKNTPEFMSSHPSPENRIKNLQNWIKEVKSNYPTV